MLTITTMAGFAQAAIIGALALAPAVATPELADDAAEDTVARERLKCTLSGDTPTGRQWGYVSTTSEPGMCVRWAIGGTAPVDYPSCHEVGRDMLGCSGPGPLPPPPAES